MCKRFFVVIALVLVACVGSEYKIEKPKQLIEKEQMIDILYDIKLISAARSKNYKRLKDSAVHTDAFIYKKYNIDSLVLRQNLDYYATRSFDEAREIELEIKARFEQAVSEEKDKIKIEDSLSKEQIKNKKLQKNKLIRNDSLSKKEN